MTLHPCVSGLVPLMKTTDAGNMSGIATVRIEQGTNIYHVSRGMKCLGLVYVTYGARPWRPYRDATAGFTVLRHRDDGLDFATLREAVLALRDAAAGKYPLWSPADG